MKGKVLDFNTGKGIPNARIMDASNTNIVVSDASGGFKLKVENFPLPISISALGFSEEELVLREYQDSFKVFLKPSEIDLSEVVVRSGLIPSNLMKTPASVGLITDADLKQIDAVNLVGIFNQVPGMYVNEGALNTNKINIRGVGARSQYSTNRIQAYFDGIPLTTGEGELTLDDFDAATLDRIEVIKGPGSSLYGAGLGGVISLYSSFPKKEGTSMKLTTELGSFNTMKNMVRLNLKEKGSAFSVSYSHLQSDSYRENSGYERNSVLVNGQLNSSENNRLSFLANLTRLKAYIPSSLNKTDFENEPQKAADNWAAAKGYESYDRGLLGISYLHNFSEEFVNTTSLYVNFRNAYEPRPFNILKEERTAAGARTKFNLDFHLFKKESALSFGGELYREWYGMSTYENLYEDFPGKGSLRGQRLSVNDQDRQYANFFSQLNTELSSKWHLEAGFNINTTSYKLTDLFSEDEVDQSGSYRFQTIFSPRLATVYEITSGKDLYASVSHGFSTPTVAETLTPEGKINTNLRPEVGMNYEIGFKGNWFQKRLYTELSVYSIRTRNLLVAQRIAEDQYVGVNAGSAHHNGLEFVADYNFRISDLVRGRGYANTSFNFFKFNRFVNDGVDNSGNELPGVPGSVINLGLDLSTVSGFSFFGSYRAVSEIALNDANTAYSDAYDLFNFKAIYDLVESKAWKVQLYAGVHNLFDERYASSILTNAVGFGGAQPRYYYPGNPRNYSGGVSLSYNF